MTRHHRHLILLIVVGLTLVACGAGTDPTGVVVEDAVVRVPAGANSAMYFSVTNPGSEPDRLLGVSVGFAMAELHESTMADGVAMMSPVSHIEIPAGETVVLEPGGLHVMLMSVGPLEAGQQVSAELEFEQAGTIVIEVPVRDLGDE